MRLLGLDIGTGSSKGVLVDEDGQVLATAVRPHHTSSPHAGWYEHDAVSGWWLSVQHLVRELLAESPGHIDGIGVSGIGPAVLLTDADDLPVRPAILYGIDTRAQSQISRQTELFGEDALLLHAGNRLTTQSVGPKLQWIAENEPVTWSRARHLYSAPSWIVRQLTGEYTLDAYSASNADPLYDLQSGTWWERGWAHLGQLKRPSLPWPADIVGHVTGEASRLTGLEVGTPVIAGTIDAMAEAYSVGVSDIGDTMIMYGSTLFIVQSVANPAPHNGLWGSVGRTRGSFASLAGLATSGLITSWLTNLTSIDFATIIAEAEEVPAGSDGLLLLPYFEGERTPLFDPNARGTWVGLTLRHTRAHLYRSVLEGVAHGVRHNLEAMTQAGAAPKRLVAVGGGTQSSLWLQIVSDVTGLPQDLPSTTVGASYGDARMVADALGMDTSGWNPPTKRIEPDPSVRALYDEMHAGYLALYPAIRDTMHSLARLNR